MSSRKIAARAIALVLSGAGLWAQASVAAGPPPAPPADLAARTRGAWIDVYRHWLELPDGDAMPVDPGPAICVGTDGFALIDQNAVAGALHLFATIRGRGPFAARARAFDPSSALAAIQLHPAALDGTPCLQPPGDDSAPVAAGDVLFALGPAGVEPTPLRVKRATPDTLTFVGGLDSTFLAGSPLVDADGSLCGVLIAGTTGGNIGRQHAAGPFAGLAKRRHAIGAIPLTAVLDLFERVKSQRDNGMPAPPAVPVVRVSEEVLPPGLRKAAGVTADDLALYFAATGEIGVEFLTPPSLDTLETLQRFPYAPGKTFFNWPAHVQMWEAMVVVQSSPRLEWSTSSRAKAAFAPLTLERGSATIAPFDSFVECLDDAMPIANERGSYDACRVKGCRTFYLFPPEAFAPGADVVVRVTADAHGSTVAVPVRPETQARIAADFAPWAAALRARATGATVPVPEAIIAPIPPVGVPYATRLLGDAGLRVTWPGGYSFSVTRLSRDGHRAIRIPAVRQEYGLLSPTATQGVIYVDRDAISFEPTKDPQASKRGFRFPRAEVAVTITATRGLRIKAGGKKWYFEPMLEVIQPSLGDVFSSAFYQARAHTDELIVKLLGDFERALRAFDEPDILNEMPLPQVPSDSTPAGDDRPDDRPQVRRFSYDGIEVKRRRP